MTTRRRQQWMGWAIASMAACLMITLTGCDTNAPAEPNNMDQATQEFNELMKRPDIDQAVASYQQMYTTIRDQLSAAFPGMTWNQTLEPSPAACESGFLSGSGMQRMTARVLAALLFCERDTTTAGEIAERLDASQGAVSTAIKSLDSAGLIEQVPAPGSRRTHYRLPDEGWARLMSTQNSAVKSMLDAAQEGIDAVGEDTPAGRRLATMRDFYAYLMRELPTVIDRPSQHHDQSHSRKPTGLRDTSGYDRLPAAAACRPTGQGCFAEQPHHQDGRTPRDP